MFISQKTNLPFGLREEYKPEATDALKRHKVTILLGLLLYALTVVIRSWQHFATPGFYAEDSVHYFNFFYGNLRQLSDIFQHPNGYYNIYNNLVAFLVARADILIQPLLYHIISASLCILTVAACTLSGLFRTRSILFISPFFLGLTGMNHVYYYISLTFQMYNVVLLLLILLFYDLKNWPRPLHFAWFLLISFLIWSGPYSVLVVPFCLSYMVLFRGRDLLSVGLLAVTVAYTLAVSKSTIMLGNLFDLSILALWGKTLVTDVFFLGFKDSVNTEKLILIASIFTILIAIFRKDRFYLKISLLLLIIIVASFAPLFLSKKYLLYQTIYPCHRLIAQFFWVIFILFSLDRLLLLLPRHQDIAGAGIVVLLAVFICVDNFSHSDKYAVPLLPSTTQFLHRVKEVEQMDLLQKHQRAIISTAGTGIFKAAATIGDRSKNGKLVIREHFP